MWSKERGLERREQRSFPPSVPFSGAETEGSSLKTQRKTQETGPGSRNRNSSPLVVHSQASCCLTDQNPEAHMLKKTRAKKPGPANLAGPCNPGLKRPAETQHQINLRALMRRFALGIGPGHKTNGITCQLERSQVSGERRSGGYF